jgi:excisionase family DNA binding protein
MSQVVVTSTEDLKKAFREVFLNSDLPELIKSIISPYFKKEESPKPAVLLTRVEVAKILNITLPTLQKHTESGLLKAHYIGRRVLYDQNELNNVFNNASKIINTNKIRTGRATPQYK